MNWVTWENVRVDRMASAWLIKRFIDPEARFAFIPAGRAGLPADTEPFDIPGVRYSHRRGHSTFHALLKEVTSPDPVLEQMARIVDEADVVQEVALEPAAPGLDLVCRGLSMTSSGDEMALERGTLIFEAIYAALAAEQR